MAWKAAFDQSPGWYASDEALTIADTVLLHQQACGGWPVGRDMTRPPLEASHYKDLSDRVATFDDGGTIPPLQFLARVVSASATQSSDRDAARMARHHAAFLRGFDYVLAAQYPNGGFPQYFPLRGGYHDHVTFNDDATYNIMRFLRDVARGERAYRFLDTVRRERAAAAFARGIECILRSQVVIDGRKTVWGAQHDVTTLLPASARKFEQTSLSSSESVGLVRLLMSVEPPTSEIVAAVRAAVAWFEDTKLTGIRYERFETPEGRDARAVAAPAAPPTWARFYELGSNRPIFIGRDAIVKYRLADIERERRGHYGWYRDTPRALLEQEYPPWAAKWLGTTPAASE